MVISYEAFKNNRELVIEGQKDFSDGVALDRSAPIMTDEQLIDQLFPGLFPAAE